MPHVIVAAMSVGLTLWLMAPLRAPEVLPPVPVLVPVPQSVAQPALPQPAESPDPPDAGAALAADAGADPKGSASKAAEPPGDLEAPKHEKKRHRSQENWVPSNPDE
jgi:hypothetical protein